MRYISLVIACLFALGCGAGNGFQGPGSIVQTFSSPSITTLTPNSVPVNSVPFTMTIDGNNFGTDALVFWNGAPLFTIFVSSHEVLANLTQTNLMFAGLVPVYVRTAGQNSNTVRFNVAVP
jgi:IPT/TIG domain